MASQVKRETMMACLSCRLCDSILRDATTISECLHTFCRKCIFKKIREDEIECCPVCNIDLGGAPLEKLRPDHNLQDLRAKIFPLKRIKANAPEIVSLSARRKERSISSLIVSTPRVSTQAGTTGKRAKTATRKVLRGNGSLAERTVKKEESSFHKELMGHEPEDIVAFSKVEELKSLLAARDGELEARLLLIRGREDEVCGLRAKIESLMRERDEAMEKADRLGKELQECKSKGQNEDESSASEELEHELELAVIAACITTRYQVCREWERQGTLGWELEFSAEDYHKFREFVDKNGTSNQYPHVEVYEEKWRKFVARHRPLESPRTREEISLSDSGTNDHVEAGGQSIGAHCCV